MTGTFTLPVTVVLTILLWMLPDLESLPLAGGLAGMVVVAYLLMEWNNRCALLRVWSRMVSATYLVLMLVCPFLHVSLPDMVPSALLVLSCYMLSRSYQRQRAEGEIFHAFLFISLGSLLFRPLLLVLPLFYVSMLVQLRSFTWRTFFAGLFGAAVPYWFLVVRAIWENRLDALFSLPGAPWQLSLPDYGLLEVGQLATAGFVVLLVLLSLLHILRTAYNDKIRTRMLFYALMLQVILFLVLLLVFPQWFDPLFRLLIAASAPLLGHYFTLARGRFMDHWFVVCLVAAVALGLANYLSLWSLL